jgi:hypothetical protein
MQNRIVLSFLLVLMSVGCGSNGWMARTYPTRGEITINGKAPENAVIKLVKIGEQIDTRKSDCWALVQSDGSYVMTTYEPGDGAPEGEYAWSVRWPMNPMTNMPDRLNEAYADPENPYMTVTIKRGKNELPKVELKDVELSVPAERLKKPD